MTDKNIVSDDEWLEARQTLLQKEKEFTRLRDELTAARQKMPWRRIDKDYGFSGPDGNESLAELFAGKKQLIVYHFMFGPDWQEGCPSCSFWADNYNGVDVHLAHRDTTLLAISNTSFDKLEAYRQRMGWTFKWVSSLDSDFNRDFDVSFTSDEVENGEMYYNYSQTRFPASEAPGFSVFYKDDSGEIFHTYSTYARGLDLMNGAYNMLDLTPIGRNEQGDGKHNMYWLRRRDQYED
jgi:predicted dithiol-disulfide oxidoreductase (DUF899 family)